MLGRLQCRSEWRGWSGGLGKAWGAAGAKQWERRDGMGWGPRVARMDGEHKGAAYGVAIGDVAEETREIREGPCAGCGLSRGTVTTLEGWMVASGTGVHDDSQREM